MFGVIGEPAIRVQGVEDAPRQGREGWRVETAGVLDKCHLDPLDDVGGYLRRHRIQYPRDQRRLLDRQHARALTRRDSRPQRLQRPAVHRHPGTAGLRGADPRRRLSRRESQHPPDQRVGVAGAHLRGDTTTIHPGDEHLIERGQAPPLGLHPPDDVEELLPTEPIKRRVRAK